MVNLLKIAIVAAGILVVAAPVSHRAMATTEARVQLSSNEIGAATGAAVGDVELFQAAGAVPVRPGSLLLLVGSIAAFGWLQLRRHGRTHRGYHPQPGHGRAGGTCSST